jgi:hypothetical protein
VSAATDCNNSFAILTFVADETLIQTATDLGVHLADDEEGCKTQITAIKAEELVRANLGETNYRSHLEILKHKDCVQGGEGLDLAIIDNEQRDFQRPSDSNHNSCGKTNKNQKGNRRRKK